MKRVVIDCFQLRVKAGNEGQRAALRSRRREMRDCDGGCGAVPLAAAVERRQRRGPKGKGLRGPLRTRHKQVLEIGHQPQERTHSALPTVGVCASKAKLFHGVAPMQASAVHAAALPLPLPPPLLLLLLLLLAFAVATIP